MGCCCSELLVVFDRTRVFVSMIALLCRFVMWNIFLYFMMINHQQLRCPTQIFILILFYCTLTLLFLLSWKYQLKLRLSFYCRRHREIMRLPGRTYSIFLVWIIWKEKNWKEWSFFKFFLWDQWTVEIGFKSLVFSFSVNLSTRKIFKVGKRIIFLFT